MKKLLNLLFILSIFSPQLWAAESAALPAKAAAAAATAPAGFESKAGKENAEDTDFNRILALLKALASHDDFKLVNPEDPEEVRNKTNCMHVAHKIIQKIFGIDMQKEAKRISEALRNKTPHPDVFMGELGALVNDKIGHALFDDSVKKEYKLFYISKRTHLTGVYHVFLVLKIGSPVQTNYIILQAWNEITTLPKWVGIDLPPVLASFTVDRGRDTFLRTHKSYNPSNKLIASDVKRYMEILFSAETLNTPPRYFVKTFDHPNLLDLLTKAALSPASIAPAASVAASVASPSCVVPAKKCAQPDCQNEGTRTCGRCHNAKYCSPECQKKDWPTHKLSCVPAPAKKS